MTDVTVVVGSGAIGQAIARRVSNGRHVVLADLKQENADRAAEVLELAGYKTTTATVDVSDRSSVQAVVATATSLGEVKALIQAAGVSPSQAPVAAILNVDLFGTAMLLEEFGRVIARGGSGVVISSQSGYRMPALTVEQDEQLATAPADALLDLPFVREVTDTLHAYQISNRVLAATLLQFRCVEGNVQHMAVERRFVGAMGWFGVSCAGAEANCLAAPPAWP